MELANFRVQKSVNISQEKLGSRVVQVETNLLFFTEFKKIVKKS